MSLDINNNYRGTLYGRDRLGYTTPDADASEPLRPFLPVPYPAPYLPGKRLDEGHPVGAQVVLSSHDIVGVDKSGALVPAGLMSGNTGASLDHANGVGYTVLVYGQNDVGFARNALTGNPVAAAGEYVVISAPNDGVNTDHITLPNGNVVTPTTGEIAAACLCDLIPGSAPSLAQGANAHIQATGGAYAGARPIGYVVRNVFQFLGGVNLLSTVHGIFYTLESMVPLQFRVHNYMHEMGTAIQTHFVLRMPWIGSVISGANSLQGLADSDGVSGYVATDFGRSFVHFTGGAAGNPQGLNGASVVPSKAGAGADAGNYANYDATVNSVEEICGRVIGVESMYPIRDFANRVRTQFERATEAVGPFTTKTPSIGQLGGSATRGMDYMINLTNDGILRLASDQNKAIRPEYATYLYVHFLAR
jgi:hypothetical protein